MWLIRKIGSIPEKAKFSRYKIHFNLMNLVEIQSLLQKVFTFGTLKIKKYPYEMRKHFLFLKGFH